MLAKFKEHIDLHFPFLKKGKSLIAVSGGIDSVVLTHLCHQLGFDFSLCHCNFKLRGQESDDDEAFVKNLGKELQVPTYTTFFETEKFAKQHKLSIQIAARDLRYQWFYELLENKSYDYVLTAHNTNDNLETFLINMTRGSGLKGFTGIPAINQQSIRPLLRFSRDEITLYAIKNEIVWREDKSNSSIKYIRNKIRHKILPVLKEINPHLLENFQKTIENLKESESIVDDFTKNISDQIITREGKLIKLSIKELKQLRNKKAYLYQILSDYGFSQWNDILDLISAQPGKQIFSKTHRLIKDRYFIILTKINKNQLKNPVIIEESDLEIKTPIHICFEQTSEDVPMNQSEIIVNKELLNYPLRLRKWRHGDGMYPIGMTGSKKISQLFKDNKLSLIDKEKIWLLVDANNTIIWVVGLRQDRRFAVSETDKNRLKISLRS